MKHLIRDMLQIILAVLVTTSMVIVNAQKPPKVVVVKPVVVTTAPKAVQTVPAPKTIADATPQTKTVKSLARTSQPVPLTPHQQLMATAGIASTDFGAADYIISHESGWCTTKWEGEIGYCPSYHGVSSYDGYGLCQSTPPQKMAVAGSDWQTNPITQLKWCSLYAATRYGSWWAAYDHWLANHNW